MKKLIIAVVGIMATVALSAATINMRGDDYPIKFAELPAQAQEFVNEFFGKEEVSHVIKDVEFVGNEYKVVFVSGTKIDFNNAGEWVEVDCRYSAVPEGIVPVEIASYVKDSYPANKVVEINKERNEWEVKLSGGLELKFNSSFRLVEIDD